MQVLRPFASFHTGSGYRKANNRGPSLLDGPGICAPIAAPTLPAAGLPGMASRASRQPDQLPVPLSDRVIAQPAPPKKSTADQVVPAGIQSSHPIGGMPRIFDPGDQAVPRKKAQQQCALPGEKTWKSVFRRPKRSTRLPALPPENKAYRSLPDPADALIPPHRPAGQIPVPSIL